MLLLSVLKLLWVRQKRQMFNGILRTTTETQGKIIYLDGTVNRNVKEILKPRHTLCILKYNVIGTAVELYIIMARIEPYT